MGTFLTKIPALLQEFDNSGPKRRKIPADLQEFWFAIWTRVFGSGRNSVPKSNAATASKGRSGVGSGAEFDAT